MPASQRKYSPSEIELIKEATALGKHPAEHYDLEWIKNNRPDAVYRHQTNYQSDSLPMRGSASGGNFTMLPENQIPNQDFPQDQKAILPTISEITQENTQPEDNGYITKSVLPKLNPNLDTRKEYTGELSHNRKTDLYRRWRAMHGDRNTGYEPIDQEDARRDAQRAQFMLQEKMQAIQRQEQLMKEYIDDYRNAGLRANGLEASLASSGLLNKNPDQWTPLEKEYYSGIRSQIQALRQQQAQLKQEGMNAGIPERRMVDMANLSRNEDNPSINPQTLQMLQNLNIPTDRQISAPEIQQINPGIDTPTAQYLADAHNKIYQANYNTQKDRQSLASGNLGIANQNQNFQTGNINAEADQAYAKNIFNGMNSVQPNDYAGMQAFIKNNQANLGKIQGFNINAIGELLGLDLNSPAAKRQIQTEFNALKEKTRIQAGIKKPINQNRFN
jgi:hypothetical protein